MTSAWSTIPVFNWATQAHSAWPSFSASKMTYIGSGGAFNSFLSLTHSLAIVLYTGNTKLAIVSANAGEETASLA